MTMLDRGVIVLLACTAASTGCNRPVVENIYGGESSYRDASFIFCNVDAVEDCCHGT